MTGGYRRRVQLAGVFLALVMRPGVASAQTPTPWSPSQMEFLGASFAQSFQGREVWITPPTGPRLKVRLGTVGPAGVAVTSSDGQSRTLKFSEISRIQKVTHRLRNHMIAGAIIGSSLGLLGALACEDEPDCAAAFFLIYGGIGTGIGALNGAIRNNLNRDDDLIYQAGARTTTTLSVSPILSRQRKGVSLSLSWR